MPQAKSSQSNKTKKDAKPTTKTATEATTAPIKSKELTIAIVILSAIIICTVVILATLFGFGVIKISDSLFPEQTSTEQTTDTANTTAKIIDNPNPRVKVKDANLAKVYDIEFYLPDDFEAAGRNDSGAYTYNLVDDDGWAQVLVYNEKTNLTPEQFLNKISPYLDITDKNYQMNGTSWVQAENANALAYATELDGTVYAVYYSVKLDSDATAEAMSMIPKTLYMARIYNK